MVKDFLALLGSEQSEGEEAAREVPPEPWEAQLRCGYIGTDSMDDFEYYVRKPRTARPPLPLPVTSPPSPPQADTVPPSPPKMAPSPPPEQYLPTFEMVQDDGEDDSAVRRILPEHEQWLLRQREKVPIDTCEVCGGYLPFGPQCFPCLRMEGDLHTMAQGRVHVIQIGTPE